jgi:DNA-binding transcriptional MerR regulator
MSYFFSIKELEQYSGIKAHTIRIWEKRYKLLEPLRTDTNIRMYSSDHVRKLLNVTTLLRYGWKISSISNLTETDLCQEVDRWTSDFQNGEYESQLNALINAMISFDESEFELIFNKAVDEIGFKDTVVEILYPFLNKIGHFFQVDKITPAHEHFASSIIRRKLNAAIDNLEYKNDPSKPRFLLFLPENEHHELGLLLSNYLIRRNGNPILYLGTNLPEKNLLESIKTWSPDYVHCFFVTKRTTKSMERTLANVENMNIKQTLLSGFEQNLKNLNFSEKRIWLRTPLMLEKYLS